MFEWGSQVAEGLGSLDATELFQYPIQHFSHTFHVFNSGYNPVYGNKTTTRENAPYHGTGRAFTS